MPVLSMLCVSVTCDGCGYSFDECDQQPTQYIRILKEYGWEGTYRKCYCPKCAQLIKSKKGRNSNR